MTRKLTKTYDPMNPFVVERHDEEGGEITYELWDTRPETYRRLCKVSEVDCEDDIEIVDDRMQPKKDIDMIASALNMVYGSRPFQSAQLRSIPPRPLPPPPPRPDLKK